jgi:hypothetical protein
MIAITRHPACLHLCFIDDQEAPLRDTKKFVDLHTLNMLWTGEVDVLLIEPVTEPDSAVDSVVDFVEPDDREFIRLMSQQKQQRLVQGAFMF